jgi:ABC-type sugar transport system substrate-binding protein
MGFSQVGAESAWRVANTASVKQAAKDAGIRLLFEDAQQDQQRQIAAIRGFIDQRVDVIAFSPVVEPHWDTVLRAAKDAGIPVIVTDRAIETRDPGYYTSLLGSDFWSEGKKVGQWMAQRYRGSRGEVNVVELEGTAGSAPAVDRKDGFSETVAAADTRLRLVASAAGDFTRESGRTLMRRFLADHPDIDVVYAHNDDMGLGAIDAIEETDLRPGTDIEIVTVDGSRAGLEALAEGKISYIVECSPLLGPQLMDLAKKVVAGEAVPKRVVTQETTFTREQARRVLPQRQY